MPGLHVFPTLAAALRAGFQVAGLNEDGYVVRTRTERGWQMALALCRKGPLVIHLIFNRPLEEIKLYDDTAALLATYKGEGDTWSTKPSSYGFDDWCPPGHFMLGAPQSINPPIKPEGFGQIPVFDLDNDTCKLLQSAGRLTIAPNGRGIIGGVELPIHQLAVYNRTDIMIHCGGSDAPDPFADYQQLCKTNGCTRMWNVEWRDLSTKLSPLVAGNTIIYSIIGDPVVLPT